MQNWPPKEPDFLIQAVDSSAEPSSLLSALEQVGAEADFPFDPPRFGEMVRAADLD